METTFCDSFFTLLLCYLLISSGKQDKFTAKLSVLVTAARPAKRVEILYPAKRFQNNFFIYIYAKTIQEVCVLIFPFYSARFVGVERDVCCNRQIPRPELSSLNKSNELVSSCRHRNKMLLRNNSSITFMQIYIVYK